MLALYSVLVWATTTGSFGVRGCFRTCWPNLRLCRRLSSFLPRDACGFGKATWPDNSEAAILATALVSTGVLAFTAETGWRADTQALAFAPVPLFIWASLRFGAWGLSASLLGTSMFSIWNAMHGRDPFIGASRIQNVMTLQILFCSVGSPLLLLSVCHHRGVGDKSTTS